MDLWLVLLFIVIVLCCANVLSIVIVPTDLHLLNFQYSIRTAARYTCQKMNAFLKRINMCYTIIIIIKMCSSQILV